MSEVRTPPRRLVDLNPEWVKVYGRDEVYGISFDCPCGRPCFEPKLDENGKVQTGVDGKVIGAVPWAECCTCGGRMTVPTKSNWTGVPPSASAIEKGWALTGDSFETVTLSPSIHMVGHWHGFLRNGLLESC